jgi:alkylation response protein AidB-like acyl-CoA dehydrogenase
MTHPRSELVPGPDERALAETVRDVLADLSPISQVRADVETDAGYSSVAWKALSGDVGLCGLTVPESYGGLGLSWAAVNVVHEELGRGLYPGPILATGLATSALTAAPGGVAEQWLPRIATGEAIGAVAVADRSGDWSSAGMTATRLGNRWELDGQRWFVVAGHTADLLLVLAAAPGGDSLFAVEADAPGLRKQPMVGMDLTRRLAHIEFTACPAVLVGGEGEAAAGLAAVGRHLRLAVAAEASGGLAWCVDTCVAYASTRQQFGRVIGGFQAVAHACVDLFGARNSVQAAARWAAVATQNGERDSELAGHVAALRAGEAYRIHTESAIHLLGGIGFTWEHDMHLYYRRARAAAALAGSSSSHRLAIADLAGLTGATS